MMAPVEFEFASLRYLNLWIDNDSKIVQLVEQSQRSNKLKAIAKCANSYSVQRNFRREFDVGLGLDRYQPILDTIEEIPHGIFEHSPRNAVKEFSKALSKRYGNFNVLSASSKILWMWFGRESKIMIYDGQAKNALNTNTSDFEKFCEVWEEKFKASKQRIVKACEALPRMHKYVSDVNFSDPKLISELSSQDWFHRRVFDTYLWNQGG